MNTTLEAPTPQDNAVAPKKTGWRRFGGKFLLISIAVHLLFGVGATLYIVQTITAKRKLTFKAGPPSPNPSNRATEHRVQMAKKQTSMSAPAQSKRIVSTGMSKVSLPEMPVMPTSNSTANSTMAGMGGTGLGPSTGGMGKGIGGTGGSGPTLFGFNKMNGGALTGTFYDLKQTPDRKPTGMDVPKWDAFFLKWVKSSWDESELKKFYAGPKPLYAPYMFVPMINADEGPKAFGVEKQVQPTLWFAYYKARVVPAESGRYRFVGLGDDVMAIRMAGHVVFSSGRSDEVLATPPVQYNYQTMPKGRGPVAGKWFDVLGGGKYDLEILIGECPGGLMHAYLLLEKQGGTYKKDAGGLPILPIFRVNKAEPKFGRELDGAYPPFSVDEKAWGVAPAVNPLFAPK